MRRLVPALLAIVLPALALPEERASTGVEQVNRAVGEMGKVTQQNAAASEESSFAATELSSQAEALAAWSAGSSSSARRPPRAARFPR